MCLYPRLIRNKKYEPNKKNGGEIPQLKDIRTLSVPVKCGKCEECMKAKSREYQIRLQEEIKTERYKKFITLTFSNEELNKLLDETGENENNKVATIAVRRFLERWRWKYKKSIKHWLITEMGHENTERIHLHGILFTKENENTIRDIWKYGNIWIGRYCNAKTVNYIIKYVTKIDKKHPGYQPKILTSPGIGKNYTNTWNAKQNRYKPNGETNETYKLNDGNLTSLPIYYRNKIYTDEERENLWLEKLEKGERYIKGKKYKVKTREDTIKFLETLKYNQEKNISKGYGSDKWKREYYETQIQKLNNIK